MSVRVADHLAGDDAARSLVFVERRDVAPAGSQGRAAGTYLQCLAPCRGHADGAGCGAVEQFSFVSASGPGQSRNRAGQRVEQLGGDLVERSGGDWLC
jgi:hypothetical protein